MSDKMTVSQALRRIAKLKGQIGEYRNRAYAGVSYKQDAKPAFQFQDCINKMVAAQKELLDLQTKIAIANSNTNVAASKYTITLTEAIIKLQQMKGDIVWLKTLAVRPQAETEEKEWGYDEDMSKRMITFVKWICDLPESQRADMIDEVQKQFDELNDAVERMNHITLIG
jgi:hypothetical protein